MGADRLIHLVEKWGDAKGITGPDGENNVHAQLEKLEEEFQELKDAIAEDNEDLIIDSIGDMTVVLILLARAKFHQDTDFDSIGPPFTYSLSTAYEEIKGRTGRMINGTFVKDA